MVTAVRLVVCQGVVIVPVAGEYCTDQPVTFTAVAPRLNSSMKSFLRVAPLFPPPPYTWLITMPVETKGACGLAPAQAVLAVSTMSAYAMASANPRGFTWFLEVISAGDTDVSVDMKTREACPEFILFYLTIF